MKILETSRLLVREIELTDIDALFRLYSGPHMTDYIAPLYPYEEEKDYEEDYIRNIYGFYGFGMWVVIEKATGEMVGRAGIEYRAGCRDNEAELGYAIREDRWRLGYAEEVTKAIMDWAVEEYEFTGFCARVNPENAASIGLLKKLGFSDSGEVSQDGEAVWRRAGVEADWDYIEIEDTDEKSGEYLL